MTIVGGSFEGVLKSGNQMDCIDESTNTTTYLNMMAKDGLLHFHSVEPTADTGRQRLPAHRLATHHRSGAGHDHGREVGGGFLVPRQRRAAVHRAPFRLALRMGTRDLRALLAAVVVACARHSDRPRPHRVTVCVDYGCDYTRSIDISMPPSGAQWKRFSPTVATAEAERRAVAQAIGRLERIVGGNAGTAAGCATQHRARRDASASSTASPNPPIPKSTFNCSRTRGQLVHHRVIGREVRRPWLFEAHWTAVIEEIATGERYAIDSWYGANGEPAVVQPLATWRRGDPVDDAPR